MAILNLCCQIAICVYFWAFGGIVILNRLIDKKLATKLSQNFYEIIAAKKFNKAALNILKNKKRLILIKTLNLIPRYKNDTEIFPIDIIYHQKKIKNME